MAWHDWIQRTFNGSKQLSTCPRYRTKILAPTDQPVAYSRNDGNREPTCFTTWRKSSVNKADWICEQITQTIKARHKSYRMHLLFTEQYIGMNQPVWRKIVGPDKPKARFSQGILWALCGHYSLLNTYTWVIYGKACSWEQSRDVRRDQREWEYSHLQLFHLNFKTETWNDNLRDSQLLTGWDSSNSFQRPKLLWSLKRP